MTKVERLSGLIRAANGRRWAHIIDPQAARDILGVYNHARREARKNNLEANSVVVTYDPNCVPNCYTWLATTTAVTIGANRLHAYPCVLQTRPYGRKWRYRIMVTQTSCGTKPEGYQWLGNSYVRYL